MSLSLSEWSFLAVYRAFAWGVSRSYGLAWYAGMLSSTREPLHAERLGRWQSGALADGTPVVWVHAASVGEVSVAKPLIRAVKQRAPSSTVLLTCNTPTGRRVARQTQADEVHYFPLDSPWILRRILARVRVRVAILVETEIWPNLLLELARIDVPAVLVNGRISAGSFKRYRLVRPLMAAALATLRLLCVRDSQSRERLLELGADRNRAFLVGDLKYDGISDQEVDSTTDLLAPICGGAPTLLAASTHQGEDVIVLDAYMRARTAVPELRLVVAPRHPARTAEVVKMIDDRGVKVERWTNLGGRTDWQVLVVDTVGELRGFMVSAIGAFVGGSLVDVGGHNLVEPAAFALPIVSGPHLASVTGQAVDLQAAGSMEIVTGTDGLSRVFESWLRDPHAAARAGSKGRDLVAGNSGALAKTMALIGPLVV